MKIRCLFLVFIVLAAVMAAVAQRTVTNSDLERYRQTRVQAEKDLRENYARLGFPSPDAITRRNQESRKELLKLSARLSAERLEQERLDAQVQQAMWLADAARQQYAGGQVAYYDSGAFFPGYYLGGGRLFGSRPRYQQPGYFAGGQFWATGPRTPPRPMIRVEPRR